MFKNLILTMTMLILAAGVLIYAVLSNKVPPPKSAVAEVNHIIPMPKPSPTPSATPMPKTHDYVYNAVEYRIAATGTRNFDPLYDETLAGQSYYLLSQAGYTDLSFQEVLAFFKKYRLRQGDTVKVRARVVRKILTTHIKLESPFPLSCSNESEGWNGKVAIGQTVTLKGTVYEEGAIFDCSVM